MTIGARVLKTGIAVSLALYSCSLLHYEPPIFAAVAAIIMIQPSIYRSWQQLMEQLQTNVVGAAVALGAGMIFGNDPIAVGIVAIIVILICIRTRMESTIGLTLVTVVAIMEAPGDDLSFALNRFTIILIGMGSAFLVNIAVFPPKHKQQFEERLKQTYERLSLLLRTAVSNEMKETVFRTEHDEVKRSLRWLEEAYDQLAKERIFRAASRYQHNRRLVVYKQMIKTMRRGADIVDRIEEHHVILTDWPEIGQFFNERLEQLARAHEYIILKDDRKVRVAGAGEEQESVVERAAERMGTLSGERSRLLVVASAIDEYAYQLHRLDKVVDTYHSRPKGANRKLAQADGRDQPDPG